MKHIKTKSLVLSMIVGIIIFACLQYVNAETQLQHLQSEDPFMVGQTIPLVQNCLTSSYSNISRVILPNGTFSINSQTAMIKNGDDYSYNYSVTPISGWYNVYGVCDESGIKTNWVYDFYVNPTGREPGSIFNNAVIFILFFLGLTLLIVGTLQGNPWFGFIGSIMFLILGVYTMIYGFDNYTDMYTRSVAIVFLGIGIVTMFSSAYEFIETGGSNNEED
jgi:hypothetical protein